MEVFENFILTTTDEEITSHENFQEIHDYLRLKRSGQTGSGHYRDCPINFDNPKNGWVCDCIDCALDITGMCICYSKPSYKDIFVYIIETQIDAGKTFFTDNEIELIEKALDEN